MTRKIKFKYINRFTIFLIFIALIFIFIAIKKPDNPKTKILMKEQISIKLSPKQVAQKWIKVYNSHDPDSAASLYDDKVINTQLPWGKTVEGKEGMRMTYVNVFRAFPDIFIEAENIFEEGSWVVVEWNFSGTMKGDFAGHSANNNKFNMKGCEIFKIENEKIVIQRGYWDKATMFSQLKLGDN